MTGQSETKHTRGELRLNKRQDEPAPTQLLGGEFGDDIVADCSLFITGRNYDEAAANAARIALTWNCHDELVAALRDMQQHWHHMIGLTSPKTFHDLNARAEAALAKASA